MPEDAWTAVCHEPSGNGTNDFQFINYINSQKYIRIYEINILANKTSSPANTLAATCKLSIISALSDNSYPLGKTENTSGAFRYFIPHNYNCAPLDPWTKIHPATYTTAQLTLSVLRQVAISFGGPRQNGNNTDLFACTIPFTTIWDCAQYDNTLQPITFAAGETRGLNITGFNSGTAQPDINIQFTSSST